MQRLFPQKLLTIITVDTLEATLAKMVHYGYTRGHSGQDGSSLWRQWLHNC
jgi:hypothetical protein